MKVKKTRPQADGVEVRRRLFVELAAGELVDEFEVFIRLLLAQLLVVRPVRQCGKT
jgi:hypothetical protein